MNYAGLFLIAAGAFSLLASIFDWNFFFNSRRARRLVSLMGRPAARLFYGVLGLVISIMGGLITMGLIGSPR